MNKREGAEAGGAHSTCSAFGPWAAGTDAKGKSAVLREVLGRAGDILVSLCPKAPLRIQGYAFLLGSLRPAAMQKLSACPKV